mmetsp:Transcript_41586/g.120541  ORF Transcript_41586/g.120541 Transcript_41586/m.120541 type:complete len:214 (+) Transcript_41586:109-750(+)
MVAPRLVIRAMYTKGSEMAPSSRNEHQSCSIKRMLARSGGACPTNLAQSESQSYKNAEASGRGSLRSARRGPRLHACSPERAARPDTRMRPREIGALRPTPRQTDETAATNGRLQPARGLAPSGNAESLPRRAGHGQSLPAILHLVVQVVQICGQEGTDQRDDPMVIETPHETYLREHQRFFIAASAVQACGADGMLQPTVAPIDVHLPRRPP